MNAAASVTPGPQGNVDRPPPISRPRRRGTWFVVINLGVCMVCLAYVGITMALLALFGAERLHDVLGDRAYNSFVATGGVVQVLVVIGPLLAFDALVGMIYGLNRMLRSRSWRLPGAILTAGAFVGTALLVRQSILMPDPLKDQVFSIIAFMDTEYAPGYSLSAFNSVVPGMSKAEVLARLGPPLPRSRMRSSKTLSAYAWSPTDGNYWLREIIYGPDERVQRVVVGLWID